MARKKLIQHVTFYRVVHDFAGMPEFNVDAFLDRWYDYSPFTVPTKMMMAAALRAQPMIYIVTSHREVKRDKGSNKRAQTYGICDKWIADNPLDEILKQSSRGRVTYRSTRHTEYRPE